MMQLRSRWLALLTQVNGCAQHPITPPAQVHESSPPGFADPTGDVAAPATISIALQQTVLTVNAGGLHVVSISGSGGRQPIIEAREHTASITLSEAASVTTPSLSVALGRSTPLALVINTQHAPTRLDLGGVSLVAASVSGRGETLYLDWSGVNAINGKELVLSISGGHLVARHIGRFGGTHVRAQVLDGKGELDFGDTIEHDTLVEVEALNSMVRLVVPTLIPARVVVDVAPNTATWGETVSATDRWVRQPDGSFVQGNGSAPRVSVHVTCTRCAVLLGVPFGAN